MIETSCDLYITIQSKDLATVVEQYSIREKGEGTISYNPDVDAFCFYVELFNRADLYDAVPTSELFLAANVVSWIDEIIADIPANANHSFTKCIIDAEYIEMIVNFRADDYDEDSNESFRGLLQNGKYRRYKRTNSEYEPSGDWRKEGSFSATSTKLPRGLTPLYPEPTLTASANCKNIARQISYPITSIDFRGKTFVHTACGQESEIDECVIAKGGFVRPSTVLETDYIIIGNNIQIVSAKARRAIELNQKGKNIKALTEEEFWILCGVKKPSAQKSSHEEFVSRSGNAATTYRSELRHDKQDQQDFTPTSTPNSTGPTLQAIDLLKNKLARAAKKRH